MTADFHTGRHYLTEVQYADESNLAARQSIYAYQRPFVDLWGIALSLADLRGDETIVDIGCGNGMYLGALAGRGHRGLVVGLDLSPGMLTASAQKNAHARLLVGDVQQLPIADACADVAMAMHMLYHVPDRARAIAELRRVVRAGGIALVVTNSQRHFAELDALIAECAVATIGGYDGPLGSSFISFSSESGGPELRQEFAAVERRDVESQLHVTDVSPVLDYARSMRAFVSDTEYKFVTVLAELERRATAIIARDGALVIRSLNGIFVCR